MEEGPVYQTGQPLERLNIVTPLGFMVRNTITLDGAVYQVTHFGWNHEAETVTLTVAPNPQNIVAITVTLDTKDIQW